MGAHFHEGLEFFLNLLNFKFTYSHNISLMPGGHHNARLTEQIFDGGFCADLCTKDDSGNLSGAAVCYALDTKMTDIPYVT